MSSKCSISLPASDLERWTDRSVKKGSQNADDANRTIPSIKMMVGFFGDLDQL
jgi:hypothetical protein